MNSSRSNELENKEDEEIISPSPEMIAKLGV